MTAARATSLPPDGMAADAPLLLRDSNEGEAAALLHAVAVRMASEMQKQLRLIGAAQAGVGLRAVDATDGRAWRAAVEDHLFWQFKPAGKGGPLALAMPRRMLVQLVDIFYGGDGQRVAVRETLSVAERRFATRFGEELLPLLAHAWKDTAEPGLAFQAHFREARDPLVASDFDPLLVLDFRVEGKVFGGAAIRLGCSAGSIAALTGAGQKQFADASPAIDPDWLAALHLSLGNVSLPVSSVLARPEISLARMLTLQVGDVIPLTMPRHVPLSVAGHNLAAGTLGEVGGRVAIHVEQIRKRTM